MGYKKTATKKNKKNKETRPPVKRSGTGETFAGYRTHLPIVFETGTRKEKGHESETLKWTRDETTGKKKESVSILDM